ncbi:MAG: hypothetical protein ACMUEM_01015 [Flavobacteriales bacterium AspAUS03]
MSLANVFNKELNLSIPLPLGNKDGKGRFSELEVFNVAFPKYEAQLSLYTQEKASFHTA